MKIAVRYSATYLYEESASLSPHWARIFPRRDTGTTVNHSEFTTAAGADVQYRLDLFDNLVARCFYPENLARLDFHLALDISLTEKNPFHFLLDAHAVEVPFSYLPEESQVLSPYLGRNAELVLPEALKPSSATRPTVEHLTGLNTWLHENIAYERRDEGDPHPPGQTLSLGRGSCRDFAVLFADVLRVHGVAARLASGFLWEQETAESERKAENALHAWVEAYLPGAGWVGFDPTNGVLCDHHFLPTAVGLSPADIAPIGGCYYGNKRIGSELQTSLSISEVKS